MEAAPENYSEIDFVCLHPDGAIETPGTVSIVCCTAAKKVLGLEGFHFHWLCQTFATLILQNGVDIKTVSSKIKDMAMPKLFVEDLTVDIGRS